MYQISQNVLVVDNISLSVSVRDRWVVEFLSGGLKLIYSEKATKVCEISTNYLSYVLPVK